MNKETLDALARGETLVNYREGGNSMKPLILHRQPVTIAPVNPSLVEKGDIVIAKVHGRVFCHLVTALEGDRVQISNNHGHINGWTTRDHIYGIVTHVADDERPRAMAKVRR